MESGILQLFVYGTLLHGFRHPSYFYISDNFTLVERARVKGRLYDLGEFPGAQACREEVYVIGELYRLKEEREFGWVMEQLDDYEGLNTESGEIPWYKREITTVYLSNGTSSTWIYWYNQDVRGKPEIASGDFLEYIQNKKP